jgi:DNA-binding MurR/RpiR family transcriptional regulator
MANTQAAERNRPRLPETRGSTELERRFSRAHAKLNHHRRELVSAILEYPAETYFLSSRGLARRYHVDAATIVRTVQALGYRRFADFVADLRRHFVARITPLTVVQAARRERRPVDAHVRQSVERDLENLHVLRSTLDVARLVAVAEEIHRARRIMVVGVDLAASLSAFLAYTLRVIGFDAEAPAGSSGVLTHSIRTLGKKDLLIGISFGRCLRATVEALQQARRRGVTTFGVTNSDVTPIARFADSYIVTSTASSTFSGSYAAPMSLLNAIVAACTHLHPARTVSKLRETEAIHTAGARWFDQPDGRPRAKHARS